MDPALHELLRTGDRNDVVPAIVRIDPREPLPPTVRVVARFGDIATVRMRLGDVPEAYASDAMVSVKATRLLHPEPVDEHAVEAAGDDTAPIEGDARRDPAWPRGEGVVVAALDWGVDFTHPEFRLPDGRTRLDAIWDQGARYDPAFPNPYGYGRVYRRHEIDRALATPTPFATLGYDPRRADRGTGTHATHVLGIAAGSGRTGPGGIAPGATLLFVDLAPATGRPGRRALTDSAAVLEAIHFVDTEAAARPACINMSLGTHGGPHDGTSLVEQGLDAFLAASPRRVVVQSTGNYYARRVHAGGRIARGERVDLPMLVDREDTSPNDLEVWYRGCDRLRAHLRAPDGRVVATAERGQVRDVTDAGVSIGRLYHRARDPNNHDHQIQLRLDAPAAVGRWTLVLEGVEVEDGRFDAWIERDGACATCQPVFPPEHASTRSTTGSICNGRRSIVVGAYDAHGAFRLAPFSSSGPTRDGRAKPDLVAPGVRVLSARSTPRNARAGGRRLVRMSGTSMAAPHVTGAAALLLDVSQGALDNAHVLDLLRATASLPAGLDADDRVRCGAGRLRIGAALAAARAALAPRPSSLPEIAMETESAGTCGCTAASAPSAIAPADAEAAVEAALEATAGDLPEYDEYVVRRRRDVRVIGPVIAPVIGAGGLGAAVVAPLGGGIGVALPIGGTPAAPAAAPAAAPPAAVAPTCACATNDAPVTVASSEPTLTASGDVIGESNAPWLVTEADAAAAQASWSMPALAAEASVDESAWTPAAIDTAAPMHVRGFDEIAEQAVADAPQQDAARFIVDLLARLGATEAHGAFDEHAFDTTALPARLFDYFAGRRAVLPDAIARRFDAVALPGMTLSSLAAGDVLLRRGEAGIAHVAVIAAPQVWPRTALLRDGFRTEHGRDGGYVHVIEPGVHGATRDARFARRLLDGAQRVLPDTLVLRAQPQRAWDDAAFDETVDGRWIQQALNRVLGLDLTVDGVIGPQTRAAIRAFQTQRGLVADGVVGPRTESALRDAIGGTGVNTGMPGQTLPGQNRPGTTGTTGTTHGGIGTTTTPSDCVTLDGFAQGRDTLQPVHGTLLVGIARRILRENRRLVDVTGYASSEGDDASNMALGLRRAVSTIEGLKRALEAERPGSSATVAFLPLSRGESDQIAGGDPAANRRVVVCPRALPAPAPQPVRTRTFTVTGKSFIARIGSAIGSLDCGIPIGPVTLPGASNLGLRALAAATDIALSEDPHDDRIFTSPPPESKGYRLFSQCRVQALTRGTELVHVTLAPLGMSTDSGKECLPGTPICLQAPPLIIDQPFSTRRLSRSVMQFRWGVKGQPHRDANRPFDAICERESVYIWHEIVGTIDSSSGNPEITQIFIQGSRFPSHRLWVDNVLRGNVRQGNFSNLWDGTALDPTRVR